jgi:hypothetical protein
MSSIYYQDPELVIDGILQAARSGDEQALRSRAITNPMLEYGGSRPEYWDLFWVTTPLNEQHMIQSFKIKQEVIDYVHRHNIVEKYRAPHLKLRAQCILGPCRGETIAF